MGGEWSPFIIMKIDIGTRIEDLYSEWLFEYCSDEFGCKDQFIELLENRHRFEEFSNLIKEHLA